MPAHRCRQPVSGPAGERIAGRSPESIIRRGLCYVPQEANVFPGLSVEENLMLGGWAASERPPQRTAMVAALFPVLAERPRQRAGSLSGGERQMLAIAMALMVEPALLLLDEPSAGLAPALQRLIFDRIRDVNTRGVAIVLVGTERPRVAPALASWVRPGDGPDARRRPRPDAARRPRDPPSIPGGLKTRGGAPALSP
jgi:ABC-type branched-subunit amino acid transport system ATPase component